MLIVIGTLNRAVFGFYKDGKYRNIVKEETLEIVSCTGNIVLDEKNDIIIHAHVVVSDQNGKAFGGHLMEGCLVGATAELMVVEATGIHVQRFLEDKTNLRLLRL